MIISLLILSGLTVSVFAQDKQISGVVNVYRRVTAFGPGLHPGDVTLNSVDFIAAGDTVLLIQMQGVKIVTDESPTYGQSPQDTIGSPGGYEFLLVQSVNTVTKNVVFRNNILNSFSIKGNVQLVRVPYYNSATVTGKLTAKPWDNVDKTGGVLAMIIGRKLKLNSDIDVSFKGFRGGMDTIGDGICVNSNYSLYSLQSYPRIWTNAGYKGEGVANYDASNVLLSPMHDKGQGPHMTGGGGGNGKFGGGGGGANRGKGGDQGSSEKNFGTGLCSSPYTSSNGGATVKISYLTDGIFFGGGGGTSTHAIGSTGSSGGNGGGIVIIIADTISGNSKYVSADGETASDAILDGGAGGGGGGGSVILSVQNYSKVANDSLKISVKGGNGGTNPAGYGDGGGGGGGLIWVSNAAIPGKVLAKINYGIPGPAIPSEGNGDLKYGFTPKLNGFLFNSIRSEVTGNQVDSICSNVSFGKISGTIPVGGNTPYTFLWQSSTTSEFFGYTSASGTNNQQNYSPGLLTQTTWFRRVVTDFGATLTDTSKAVKIIVQPFIKNNIIGTSDTICFAQNPPSFTSKATLLDGNGIYSYKWQVSMDNSIFDLPVNTYNSDGYTPLPALTATSWYRRTVTSGRCIDSTAIVKITILDSLKNNKILSTPQDICFGMVFTDLTATTAATTPALAGGDNSYRFKWISDINSSGWGLAPGVNSGSGYNPTELAQKSPMNEYYFKRVVYSGMHDVCVDTSTAIRLRDYPVVTNNTITANQTICSDSVPVKLIGSTPLFGNGSYTFTWQDSSKSHTVWTDIPGAIGVLTTDYQPSALIDTTSYRRIVFSSTCSDTSNSVKIIVHKPISNNLISLLAGGLTDTTVCNGAVPHLLKGTNATGGTNIPGDYAYLWFVSNDNLTWNAAPGTNTLASYQPSSLSVATYYYKRQVISGACTVPITLSATISVTVLPLITNNSISGKATVCYNTVPTILTGTTPSGGAGTGTYSYFWLQSDGTPWVPASLVNNTSDYQPPEISVPMKYRRIVKSGSFNCCSDTSVVFNIAIDPLPTGTITNTVDTTICGNSYVDLKIHITGTVSPWKVTYRENATDGPVNTFTASDGTISFIPAATVALNTYLYSLAKVEDNNGCVATSLNGTKKAYVYRIPLAYAGPDADTCGAKYILKAVPSVGTGTWYFPSAVVASTPNNPSVTVTIDSSYNGGSKSLWFAWEEVNWQCKNKDSVKITFNKRVSSINAGPDTTLYSFDNIFHMVAHKPNTWETGNWTLITGTGTIPNELDTDTSAVVENLSKGHNSFKWTVTNGTCQNEDLVNIEVYELVIPEGFSPNNDAFNNTYIITGLDTINQHAEFKVVNGAGAEVFSTSNLNGSYWIDWDGKNSQGIDLPEGTYYFLLKLTSKGNNQVFKKSGFIILKRY